ncbi:MAG: stilbene synthase [Verrucomicrobiota bacterium]
MYLHALTNHVPEDAYTQSECWDIAKSSGILEQLKPRSAYLLERLLTNPNGIAKRHFAVPDISRLFNRSAEELNNAFQESAPKLAGKALMKALDQAALKADQLDALVVCTCTGYLCPGLTSYVAEQLGLPSNCYLQDLVGLGCGAAIPSIRSATGIANMQPDAKIAVIAIELCSAAFYIDDDPGVLVSLCLFADGASASIWSGSPPTNGAAWKVGDFDTLHLPEKRETLRFTNKEGFLKNQLDVSVPEHAAQAVKTLYDRQPEPMDVIAHGGGRDVINSIRKHMPDKDLTETTCILEQFGNLSSPSVLFALESRLREIPDQTEPLWLTSFGAGFAAHSCTLKRV